jgi:DNA invertase Pin-like site-specific DNA recombinase
MDFGRHLVGVGCDDGRTSWSNSPGAGTDPSRKMMRQIAGSFAEYEKARLVAKLRVARERKRAVSGKCEGRKSWAELNPELVREAKRLRRRSLKGHQRSLRDVAAELAKLGFVNERGTVFSASSVQSMWTCPGLVDS